MSESSSLFKVFVVLGIVFLLVGLIMPGENAAWTDFQTTLSAGFTNPSAERTFIFAPGADGTEAPLNVRGEDPETASCNHEEFPPGGPWYGCLQTQDGPGSYLTTGFSPFSVEFGVYLEAFPDTSRSWLVTNVSVTYECASNGSGVIWDFYENGFPATVLLSTASAGGEIEACPDVESNVGPYETFTSWIDTTLSDLHVADFFAGGAELRGRPGGPIAPESDLIFVSYVSVVIRYQADANCDFDAGGNPFDDIVRATYYIGCVLGAFFLFIVDFFTLLANLGSFVFSIISGFLLGFLSVFGWLFAVPGAPAEVQGVISIIILALLGWLLFLIAKFVRGSSA